MKILSFIGQVIWFIGMAMIALVYFVACMVGKLRKPHDSFYEK